MPSFTRSECGMAYLPAQYGALIAQPWKVLPGLVDAHRSRLLAVVQASVFDCVPKVDATMGYILALDQGTTSSRAILFDESGTIAATAQHEFEQFYPQAGWVEHDPTEILTSQLSCAVEALGKIGARRRANKGELTFGTIDSWLIWHLTSGQRHVTDVTNASRTLLYNIVKGEWDAEMLRLFSVPESMLPEVVWSSEKVGEVTTTLVLGGASIAGIAGDQQAALFGQLCWTAGEAKNTYGTGCFLLQNVGTEFVRSRHRLITTLAASAGRRREYALEGSIFIGGAVVQWLRDNLKLISSSGDVEALAASVPDTGGVVFVPAFVGLGAPHWDAHAAGMLIGLRRDTGPGQIARAALEAIAFQVADVLEAVHSETDAPLHALRVDGGAAVNDLLMQFQADILGAPVVRPRVTETTALGAAYLAGLATGFWPTPDALRAERKGDVRFEPKMDATERSDRRGRWPSS